MTEASLLHYVREHLPEPGASHFNERLERIAAGAQVPFHTLLKIAKGETEDPKVSTVQKLYNYFKAIEEREAA